MTTTWRDLRRNLAFRLGEPVFQMFPTLTATHTSNVGEVVHDQLSLFFDNNSLHGSTVYIPSTGQSGAIYDAVGNTIKHTGNFAVAAGTEFEIWSKVSPEFLFNITNNIITNLYPWQYEYATKTFVYPKYTFSLSGIVPTTWKRLLSLWHEPLDRQVHGTYNVDSASTNVLTLSDASFGTNEYVNWEVGVVSGDELGSIYTITANTANTVTLVTTPTSIATGDEIVLKEPLTEERIFGTEGLLVEYVWRREDNVLVLAQRPDLAGRTITMTGVVAPAGFAAATDTETVSVPLPLLLTELEIEFLTNTTLYGGQFSSEVYEFNMRKALQERDILRKQYYKHPPQVRNTVPPRRRGRTRRNPFAP